MKTGWTLSGSDILSHLAKKENKKLSVYPDEITDVGNHSSISHSHSTHQHGFPFLIPLPQR